MWEADAFVEYVFVVEEDVLEGAAFRTGLFGNALLAVLLTFIGEKLNLDLYLVAMLVFGNRMFFYKN